MSAKGQVTETTGAGRMLRPIAISVIIGAVCCVVVLLLLSVLISSRSVPQSMIEPMAIFAMSVGAFVSGFVCARVVWQNGLLCGLLCGVIFSAIVLMCSFAVPDNGFGLGALIKIMFMLLSAMLGGVTGINTKKRRK